MKILVLSNGKGEDSLAVTLLKSLEETCVKRKLAVPDVTAFALVGNGTIYGKAGYKVTATEESLPSRGFTTSRMSSLLQDLKSGLTSIIGKHIRYTRALAKNADIILCVGDIYPVCLAFFFTKKPIVHLATAISSHFRKHNFIEIMMFKKRCAAVFTRDRMTADHLISKGVKAEFLGNIMMDDPNLGLKHIDFGISSEKKVIGLMPSTREDAYENVIKMLGIVAEIGSSEKIEYLLSFSSHLNIEKLKHDAALLGWHMKPYHPSFGEIERICTEDGKCVHIISGNFGDAVKRSDLIIGMTGTGNEQAVGLGTPVVLIEMGASASRQRIEQYQKLLGESVAVAEGNNKEIAEQLEQLVFDEERLRSMSDAGKNRMGEPGAAAKISNRIIDIMKLHKQ